MLKLFFYILFLVVRFVPTMRIGTFRPGKTIRYIIAKGFLEQCEKGANIEYGCSFSSRGIGVRVGKNSGIGVRAHIGPYVTIGQDVMMAPDVVILTQNHAFDDLEVPMRLQGYKDYKPVIIEDDVWIGQRVIILPGVNIGKGAIIGAGAVVSKDVPAYDIAVGNPARVVRSRLSQESKPTDNSSNGV